MNFLINNMVNCIFVGEQLVRYGVVAMNSLEWIHEEMQDGINLSYEQWVEERQELCEKYLAELEGLLNTRTQDEVTDCAEVLQRLYADDFIDYREKGIIDDNLEKQEAFLREVQDRIQTQLDEGEFGEYYSDNDVYLIGDWKQNEEGKYEVDREGRHGYAAQTGETTVTVLWSKTTKKCRLCSPCFPNAGDLDSSDEDGYEAFDLPEEIYGKR